MRCKCLVFSVLSLCGRAAVEAQGIATDQGVYLQYASGHWSSMQSVELRGTEASPSVSPIREMGWWFRVEGDSREQPFPPPDSQTYTDGQIVGTWNDLRGTGFTVTEATTVFDNEGPSGGLSSILYVVNRNPSPRTLHLFHFVHPGAGGTFERDRGVLRGPGYVKFTDQVSGAVVRYQTAKADHFQVGGWRSIRLLLSDTSPTNLNDGGLPFGPGHAEAAFQFTRVFAPGAAYYIGPVALSSQVPTDYTRGALAGATYPGLLTHDSVGGWYSVRSLRRTTQIGRTIISYSIPSRRHLEAVDDFDGDAVADLVSRNDIGEVQIDGQALTGAPAPGLDKLLGSTGDFDGDGKADLLWYDLATRRLEIWLMNGAQRVGTRVPNPAEAADAAWTLAGSADMDGDGARDLLWLNEASRNLVIWYLDRTQQRLRGTFTNPQSAGAGWRVVAVGDFGKGVDGLLNTQDIVWQHDSTRQLVVWHMDRSGTRTSAVFTTPDTLGNDTVFGPR